MSKSTILTTLSLVLAFSPGFLAAGPALATGSAGVSVTTVTTETTLSPTPSDSILVGFDSNTAKTAFVGANHLADDDLDYQPLLKRYEVAVGSATLALPSGAHVAPIRQYHTQAVVNDPFRGQQYAVDTLKLPTAWDTTQGNAQSVIAVIDTGFGLAHQDLATKYASNPGETGSTSAEGPAPNCTSRSLPLDKACNNLDDDANGFIDDGQGWNFVADTNNVAAGQEDVLGAAVNHGTLTASLAAAATNNNVGIAGTCPLCTVLPLKALADDGSGSTTDIASAVYYAVSQNARVINLSLGGTDDDPVLKAAIAYAIAHDVVVVASAGNDSAATMDYPAAYPGVVAVVASDNTNSLASFSNQGAGAIAAPGVGTISADWRSTNQTGRYAFPSGTSMSAAIVSGVVGLLRANQPQATPQQIDYALGGSTTMVTSGSNSYPLVDVPQSLATLAQQTSFVTTPVYRFWSPVYGNDHFYTTDAQERDRVILDPNWHYEGVAYQATTCTDPNQAGAVFRFWSPAFKNTHFYTTDVVERDRVAQSPDWHYEGVAFCSMPDSRLPNTAVYRFWSPAFSNAHFYTTNANEAARVKLDNHWAYEGIGFYAR